jgi:hypothetical protein
MPQRLPLIPSNPDYQFSTELDGTVYVVQVRWNDRAESWFFSLLTSDEEPLISGSAIVLGSVIGIRSLDTRVPTGTFIVSDLSGENREPGFNDLGSRVVMSYFTEQEIASI